MNNDDILFVNNPFYIYWVSSINFKELRKKSSANFLQLVCVVLHIWINFQKFYFKQKIP